MNIKNENNTNKLNEIETSFNEKTDDEKIDAIAKAILVKYHEAFMELAK